MPRGRRDRSDSWRAAAAFALVVVTLGWAAPTAALERTRAVEPPPPEFASGPSRTGRTWELVFDDPAKVDYFCSLAMGEPHGRGEYWMGCYRADLDAVVLMSRSAWPSAREWRQLRAHEWGHARGWRHPAFAAVRNR